MSLLPYMGFAGDPGEGAVLVFAHNAREARPLAYMGVNSLMAVDYVDVRVRRIRTHVDYVRTLGVQSKLEAGLPHVIDDPSSCRCGRWGSPIDPVTDTCESCRPDDDAVDAP